MCHRRRGRQRGDRPVGLPAQGQRRRTWSTARSCSSQKCAACHTLARAGATGVTGPNLDAAFAQSRKDGLGESTFAGVVHQGRSSTPTVTLRSTLRLARRLPLMPANIVTGEDARDVAAYVAAGRRRPGRGHGPARRRRRLEGRGHRRRRRTARSTSRSPPPASPTSSPTPRPTPASVKITSENPQTTPHNIAVEGNGVDEKGAVVTGRRHVRGHRRPQARRVHVLLLRPGPPRGRHGRQAHRQVEQREAFESARRSRRIALITALVSLVAGVAAMLMGPACWASRSSLQERSARASVPTPRASLQRVGLEGLEHERDDHRDREHGDDVEHERRNASPSRCSGLKPISDDVDGEVHDEPHDDDEVPVDAGHFHAVVGARRRSGRGTTGSSRTPAAPGRS